MPASSFLAMAQALADIETLKGIGRIAAHLGLTTTQEELSNAWMAAKNSASVPEGATVVNLDQDAPLGHSWTAFDVSGTLQWFDRGTAVVNTATNAALGVVKGDGATTAPEKIKVETDGSMSIKVNELVKVIGSMLFPVGSLYCTNSTANPSSLLGFGTWSRIAGRFLRSSASQVAGGVTGGNDAASMPSHTHSISGNNYVIGADSTFDTANAAGSMSQGRVICASISTIDKGNVNDDYDDFHLWNSSGAHRAAWTDSVFIDRVTLTSIAAQASGGDNKPAYYDTNVWVRTA
jgi:hypothetical protein